MSSVRTLLAEGGPFAARFPGFSPRVEQQEMAAAVFECIDGGGALVCEAGTGTGKTLAYLCAALLAERKTIISTGTKNLQDQLFNRDLPAACDILRRRPRLSLLKGRSNYLCRYRLERAEREPTADARIADALGQVREWAGWTRTGDRAECTDVAESSPVWPRVTSTVDNCLGADCPSFERCFVVLARRRAVEADLLVVNHHLFFADLALRQDGFGEVLPGAEAVIFDEAHQLPDIASRFFGSSISLAQMRELVRDTTAAYTEEAGDMPALPATLADLETALAEFAALAVAAGRRVAWETLGGRDDIARSLQALQAALGEVDQCLQALAQRGEALSSCQRRAASQRERLKLLSAPGDDDSVSWMETHSHGFTWHLSPLEVSTVIAAHLADAARIFTSATLSINGSVEHFAARVGLSDYRAEIWESPFDYRHQTLCFLPQGLPAPAHPEYTDRIVDIAAPLLGATAGRGFLLFTSHAALERAARRLAQSTGLTLLVQGTQPREALLRAFRHVPRSVLLGTASFWEGVDVKGAALVCVVIDKLPFAAPGDPLLEARLRAIRERGDDPFAAHQLPQAVLALKQGVGRLIRDETDCGLLVLCDPRLESRGYGKVFMRSLPDMPITRELDEAVSFARTL